MNPQTIKTDILLALTFLTGVLGDFGVTLTQTRSDEIASVVTALVTGLITVVPVILATVREIKHTPAPVTLPAVITATTPPAAPPVALLANSTATTPPVLAPDPAATQPVSAI